jgi:hypothetical protein
MRAPCNVGEGLANGEGVEVRVENGGGRTDRCHLGPQGRKNSKRNGLSTAPRIDEAPAPDFYGESTDIAMRQ